MRYYGGSLLFLQLFVVYWLLDVSDCQAVSQPAPYCYDRTTCPCCKPGTCPSDGSGYCGGTCFDGYHGVRCTNRCPDNCVRCVDAPQGYKIATCTQCKDGYYSTTTQYQCQLACPPDCRTCVSSTQCTSCGDGFYLTGSKQCTKH